MRKLRRFMIPAAVLLLLMPGCGGGDGDEAGASGGEEVTESGGDGTTDPDQLAEEIAANYMECMDELKAMVESRPEPQVLKPQVQDLIDEYSQVFLEIGYRVDQNDQETVDGIGRSVMSELYGYDIQWLSEASTHYHSLDTELSALLSEVNIITQYAFFELLEEQEPEEAERLGIAD